MLVMILSCFASYINPEHSSFLAFLALTFPIWAFLTFAFLLYWVVVNTRYIYLSFIGLICCVNSINNLVAIDMSRSVDTPVKLKVVSFNFSDASALRKHQTKLETKKNISVFKKNFRKINADIYCIQETEKTSRKILDLLLGDYETHFFHKSGGTAIYSKHPIKNTGKIDFGLRTNSGIYIDIEVNGNTQRIYNVHLKSNRISKDEIADIRDINKDYDKNLRETKGILSKYGKHGLKRVQQIEKLLKHIDQSPHPVILCGDFNEPPQSYVYKQTLAKLQDSFSEKGMGIGATYAGKIPFLRIDYIFVDRKFTIIDYEKLTFPWSDHYPIISTIGIIE